MDETLILIEEYASLFLTIDEIALLIDCDASKLRREVRGKITDRTKAYHRGKLKTIIAMRRQMLDFATAGSPQAETFMVEFSEKQSINE